MSRHRGAPFGSGPWRLWQPIHDIFRRDLDYSWPVRASRLVGLLGLLQARGRMSARQLAGELEVSQRTILRDIEALSAAGIPVYAVRGSLGGFELVDGFKSDLPAAASTRPRPAAEARAPRARVRLSPRGRRLAALLGRPPGGVRIRRNAPAVAGREGWVEAWVRIGSLDAATLDMLALGAEVEVIHPPELRMRVGQTARQIADLHAARGGE
jgi:predicted DNA-binding transcriptional regulator YafY